MTRDRDGVRMTPQILSVAWRMERNRTSVNPDALWWMRREFWHNVRDRAGPDTPEHFYLAERFGDWR